jgi:nucleoside-diphosphate-sugar epimerase
LNVPDVNTPTLRSAQSREWIADINDLIVVTGAAGFIGTRVVNSLLSEGFQNIRCLVRASSSLAGLEQLIAQYGSNRCEIVKGNLLSKNDCIGAVHDASVILHLVTGRGKSYPACFQNSVVVTRNLLDAVVDGESITRFVNVSSFAVYSNINLRRGAVLDESCELEPHLELRHDAYVYAKLKQDELVEDYRVRFSLPVVTVRPCVVFGPGRKNIPGVVGLDTFGPFLHLGGGNRLPLTFVDNCADAIVLSGLVSGIDGRVYNIVDDDLPSSRQFLRKYKARVGRFRSFTVPYPLFYAFCAAWERYSARSEGQLPPVFNRRFCAFHWKGNKYPNQRLKEDLGWRPRVSIPEGMERYFQYVNGGGALNA